MRFGAAGGGHEMGTDETIPPPPRSDLAQAYAAGWQQPRTSVSIRRTRPLAAAIVLGTLAAMGATVVAAVMSGSVSRDLVRWARGREVMDPARLDTYNLAESVAFWAMIAAGVLTMFWTVAARANAERLSPQIDHRRRAGWAWAGWIVPIVNLWFPFQVVRDVRRGLDPSGRARRLPDRAGPLVVAWWVGFLLMYLLSWISGDLIADPTGPARDLARSAEVLDVGYAVATVIAGALWICVLATTERNQALRHAQAQSASL